MVLKAGTIWTNGLQNRYHSNTWSSEQVPVKHMVFKTGTRWTHDLQNRYLSKTRSIKQVQLKHKPFKTSTIEIYAIQNKSGTELPFKYMALVLWRMTVLRWTFQWADAGEHDEVLHGGAGAYSRRGAGEGGEDHRGTVQRPRGAGQELPAAGRRQDAQERPV